MAVTLFERMTGLGGVRISIHIIESSFQELHRVKLTVPNIIAMLDLTADQQTDMATIWNKIRLSSSPEASMREFFDLIMLAEVTSRKEIKDRIGNSPYLDKDIFWARIEAFS